MSRPDAGRSQRPASRGKGHVFGRKPGLSFVLRDAVRRSADRILGADLAWSALFVVVVSALLAPGLSPARIAPPERAVSGEVRIVDRQLTDERRRIRRDEVPDVYAHDTERGGRLSARLARLFEEGRKTTEAAVPGQAASSAEVEVLTRIEFASQVETILVDALRRAMGSMIVANKRLLDRESAILVIQIPEGREYLLADFSHLVDLEQAHARLRDELAGRTELPEAERAALAELTASFVDANLVYDPEATAARRQAAAASVPDAWVTVPADSLLARQEAASTKESAGRPPADEAVSRTLGTARRLAGLVAIVSLLAFFLYRYARFHQRHHRRVRRLHALLVLSVLATMLLGRAILWVAAATVDDLAPPYNDPLSYAYLIPLGGGAMLVALLSNGRIAMIYSAFTAVLFGALVGWDAHVAAWGLLAQWAAVYAITSARERAALLRAGLVAGLGSALAALAAEAIRHGIDPWPKSLYASGLAFAGGALGTGLLVSFTLPLFEELFTVLTDIRLLELSNVNNPLLSQLAVKAPGSYSHSLTVGTLAEEAAKAIGASSLLCRVAALYHDVGKLRKPEYYVENQRGLNPHDRLSPYMSALIIAAHVKDGIRMAREAGLPQQIVDIIPQHHGTRVMTFFHDKAKKNSDPALGAVSEADFRYPGPKPQSKEAAIFMLADAVEAASRTVEDPSPGRLREMIHKVAMAIVMDGQLDECDLTFADLERIEEAFLRAVVSMYHHRVDYPGFDFGRTRADARPAPSAGERRNARGA